MLGRLNGSNSEWRMKDPTLYDYSASADQLLAFADSSSLI